MIVNFAQVKGPVVSSNFRLAASVVFKFLSGKFVQLNSSGNVLLASSSSLDIIGWAMTGDWTASTTAGNDMVPVNMAHDAIYEMPIYGDLPTGTAVTEATLKGYIGLICDLDTTSNVQTVKPTGTTYNVVQVVGYKYYGSGAGQQTLLVKLVVKNLTTAT